MQSRLHRLFILLLPAEWIVILFGLLTWVLYRHFDLPFPGQPGQGEQGPVLFYLLQFLTSLDLYAAVWVVLLVLALAREGYRRKVKKQRLSPAELFAPFVARLSIGQLFYDIRCFHAILVMFVEFLLLKHLIPHVNPSVYDEWFLRSEYFLCGGELCAHRLFGLLGTDVAARIGEHYKWYFVYMSLVLVVMITQSDRKLCREYCSAFVLIFLIGVLWVYLVPTWGPIYYRPDAFEALRDTENYKLQFDLWKMKEHLLVEPKSRQAIFLISGLPSLHVAVALLGTIYLFRLSRILGAVSSVFLVLIIHSTVYLGWHYVLDDVGSILLVAMALFVVRAIERAYVPGNVNVPRASSPA